MYFALLFVLWPSFPFLSLWFNLQKELAIVQC